MGAEEYQAAARRANRILLDNLTPAGRAAVRRACGKLRLSEDRIQASQVVSSAAGFRFETGTRSA